MDSSVTVTNMARVKALPLLTVCVFVYISAPAALADGYTQVGCFINEDYKITELNDLVVSGSTDNKISTCGKICEDAGFRYAGTKAGSKCVCGNTFNKTNIGTCNMTCTGDSSEICGGPDSANVYTTGKACFQSIPNKELYFISDPRASTVVQSNELYAKQYSRELGEAGCQQACASDPDCETYSYYTDAISASNWGQRCFGFTVNADISAETSRRGVNSGKMVPCYMEENETFAGELAGMILAILIFLITMVSLHKHFKKNQ